MGGASVPRAKSRGEHGPTAPPPVRLTGAGPPPRRGFTPSREGIPERVVLAPRRRPPLSRSGSSRVGGRARAVPAMPDALRASNASATGRACRARWAGSYGATFCRGRTGVTNWADRDGDRTRLVDAGRVSSPGLEAHQELARRGGQHTPEAPRAPWSAKGRRRAVSVAERHAGPPLGRVSSKRRARSRSHADPRAPGA